MSHIPDPPDEFNRELAARVHPSDWVNPTPAGRYDLVVIGGGTAGLVTAAGAAGLGARVALVERQLLGGDCLNFGCVPSKALLTAARAAAAVRQASEFGVECAALPEVDFSRVMERLRRLRADISRHDSAERFRSLGVDVYFGAASFDATGQVVEVGEQRLPFRKAAICSGARATVPDIPGLDAAGCLTNETVFSLTRLPPRLAVIGGGPIGCELAQAFARLGSQVTLYHSHARLLPRDDPDASALVLAALQRDGVQVHLSTTVQSVRATAQGREITTLAAGQTATRAVDEILVAVGRTPNLEGLQLEAAGVAFDRHGVKVDDRLRTSNRRIFAAGDVAAEFKFTHAADFQARIVIQNALFFGRARASRLIVPWCTYTSPEAAHVGFTEEAAARRGVRVQTFTQPLTGVDRAVLDGEEDGFVKIHVRSGSDRIAGATVVAAHAGELISEITLAMRHGVGLRGIAATIHPYPTQADAIRKLGDQYNRTRLTPLARSVLRTIFRWL